jgi:hypothetical protein
MGSSPKAPKPTAQELELQRRQRTELDELTRDTNTRLKGIKRGQVGRRTLLGSGSELGIPGVRAGGQVGRPGRGGGGGSAGAGGGGGIMSSGGGGSMSIPRSPSRGSAA